MSHVRDSGRALGYQLLFLPWVSKFLRVSKVVEAEAQTLIGSSSLALSNGGNRGTGVLKADALISAGRSLTILFCVYM